jgi:hypothetical protein
MSSGAAVEWSNDVGAADWIVERLLPFGSEAVGGFLPDVFGAYARVLHPWGAGQDLRKIRWSDLALEAGVVLGPPTQREELESCAARHGAQPPRTGTLEPDELEALVDVLARFTATTQSCRFGVWEGYAGTVPAGPRVEIPGRSLALYAGPMQAAGALLEFPTRQTPNLWWPDDRAWCVASEIDFCSTYVGGSPELIERVLGDERLEAIPVGLEDRGIRD